MNDTVFGSIRTPGLLLTLLLASCSGAPAPATLPSQAPTSSAISQGRVKFVTAGTLNVRKLPASDGQIVMRLDRGARVEILASSGDWSQVRTSSGTGWVSTRHLADSPAHSTARTGKPSSGGCQADRSFRFTRPPLLTFSENGAHGLVTVEASVSAEGVVTASRVVANTTGSESLGRLAQKELGAARFDPPIRSCRPIPFIYTYKRAY